MSVEKFKEDFERLDVTKDGYLSAGDLRKSMPGIKEDDITFIFDTYDGNRDGALNFEEFMTVSQDQNNAKQGTNDV